MSSVVPALLALVPVAASFALAGLASAVMDTLAHHWERSVFVRWADGDPVAWWGSGLEVWRRRYEGADPAAPKRWWFRHPLRAWLAEPFADAWHAAKLLLWIAVAAGAALAAAGDAGPAWAVAAAALASSTGTFTLAYRLLAAPAAPPTGVPPGAPSP